MALSAVDVCVFGVSTVDIGTIIVELLSFRSSTNDSLALLSTIFLLLYSKWQIVYEREICTRSDINGLIIVKMKQKTRR